MNVALLKDISEISNKRLAECTLGKLSEFKVFDKPMIEYDRPLGLIVEKFKNCPLEGSKGSWESERGNSKWLPDPDSIPGKINPEQKKWGEILSKYGIDGINFKDGDPDFSEISKGNVEIDNFSESRTDNFDKADIELAKQKKCTPEEVAKWRKDNSYTWHECKDMTTMQKVASDVHNNIPHSGGISETKKLNGE